ncbi:MAG: hypothetical protein HYX20_00740 [Candidatus Yanofskybacteria bacterium]|nr:hypothetical protein [Candidatus Yanofskybacteria bacterium]
MTTYELIFSLIFSPIGMVLLVGIPFLIYMKRRNQCQLQPQEYMNNALELVLSMQALESPESVDETRKIVLDALSKNKTSKSPGSLNDALRIVLNSLHQMKDESSSGAIAVADDLLIKSDGGFKRESAPTTVEFPKNVREEQIKKEYKSAFKKIRDAIVSFYPNSEPVFTREWVSGDGELGSGSFSRYHWRIYGKNDGFFSFLSPNKLLVDANEDANYIWASVSEILRPIEPNLLKELNVLSQAIKSARPGCNIYFIDRPRSE